MKRFMLTGLCLLALMYFSVSAGMKMADNGIDGMRGNIGEKWQTATVSEASARNVPSGDSSHNLIAKQQILEKMNAFNLFSYMGKKLSDGITAISNTMIHAVFK
jgi:hypothetical protein